MSHRTITHVAALCLAALASACSSVPSDKPRQPRDPSSICRPGDPYCLSAKPVLNENGDMVRGIPKE
jgi:hypothetical protein